MTAQLRSELLKLRSTRTTIGLLLAVVGVVLLGAIAQGLSFTLAELASEDKQRDLFGSATGAILLALFVGVIGVTSEFRYGTMRPTLFIEPRRRIVVGAKLAASALVGLVFGTVGLVIAFGAGGAVLVGRDVDFVVSGGHVAAIVVGTIVGTALCAMIGVAVGALIRNQVGAIIVLAAYSLAVEAVLFAAVPSLGRFLPAQASNAFAGLTGPDLLSPAAGAAVLTAWTIVFAALAVLRTERTDIP
jgi:ABC-2 type transport system permease protein